MLRVVIIDDAEAERSALRELLSAVPDVLITGVADSVPRARTLLARGDYDIVFLNLDWRDGAAFGLVSQVVPPARVICVASDRGHALHAFEMDAVDFLLRPVSRHRLDVCVAKARRHFVHAKPPPAGTKFERLATNAGTVSVAVHLIVAVLSEQNYTTVWLQSAERHLVRRTLKDWEQKLPASDFMRVARGALVNLNHVSRIERCGAKGALLWLTAGDRPVRASDRQAAIVRAALSRRESR